MIVCKYKFDKSIYENLIPVFNDGYEGYTITDVTEGNIITRTIECDTLPTVMRFGENTGQYEDSKIDAKAKSLKEVLYADISSVIDGGYMFGGCINLTKINTEGWNNNSLTIIHHMFFCCKSLVNLDVTGLVSDMVVNVGFAFYYCAVLYNLTGLESWDTSNVTSMNSIFQNCTNLTSLDVSNWDTSKVTHMTSMFQNCSSLTSLDVSNFNTSEVTTMWGMFHNCKNLTSLDLSNFNTSNVTDMSNMFRSCNNLTTLDLSNWDTSNVTNMYGMFYSCKKLTSLDVSNWDTSKVTDMQQMFNRCYNLTTLDVSNFNTSKVTNMYAMFAECTNLTSLDVSNFNTSKVTTMEKIMWYNEALTVINFNNIILYDNITINSMFIQTLNIEKIYINVPNTLNKIISQIPDRTEKETGELVTTLELDDEITTNLNAKNWIVKKLVAQYRYDANTYENLIPEFNTEFTEDKYRVIDDVHEYELNINWEPGSFNGSQDLPSGTIIFDIDVANRVRSKGYITIQPNAIYKTDYDLLPNIAWFDENKNFISYYDSGTSLQEICTPINARYMRVFTSTQYNYENINIYRKLVNRTIESVNGDLPTLMRFGRVWVEDETDADNRTDSLLKILDMNTSELTNCGDMFRYNKNLTSISCEWDTSNVTYMYSMFAYCSNLTELDLSSFDTKNVTNMNSMFYNCPNLTSLDLSNFNTSKVTNMSFMFYYCSKLTTLDVSNFDTSNVTDMNSMFRHCPNLTSLDVSNFNTSNVTDMQYMFEQCNALTSVNVASWNLSNVTNISYMFANCVSLLELNVSNWDTKNVTNMGYMFNNCQSLISLDVSNFDTSNVTSMNRMFCACQSLTSLDVSNWDTSKVTDMRYIFSQVLQIQSLNLSNWNTDSLVLAEGMFATNYVLNNVTLGEGFNTSNVTTMSRMFNGCTKLTSLDVSNFDTSKVTDMSNMFYYCQSLTSLDVSNFDTSKVTTMEAMFYYCNKLKNINICNWDFGKVTNIRSMFSRCYGINIIDAKKLDFTNCINNIGEFIHPENCTQLKYFRCDISNTFNNIYYMLPDRVDKEQGVIISDAEISEEILTKLASKNWTVVTSDTLTKVAEYVYNSKIWNSMIPTFNDEFVDYFIDDVEDENGLVTRTISSMGGLPTKIRFGRVWVEDETDADNRTDSLLKILNMNTSGLTNCDSMFRYNTNLTSITCEWDTSNVTTMHSMFANCHNLTSLDLSNFNTSNVTIMYATFSQCHNLTSLDVSNWNTSKVTRMESMFYNCNKLTSLDVSNFDTSNVNNMGAMFRNCKNLTSLDLSNFDTSNVITMTQLFRDCTNLTSLDVSNWDTSEVVDMYTVFYNCISLTSLDISNWDTSSVTDMSYMFHNTSKLSDIGMLYCTPSTINTIASNLPTTRTQTIWVQDTDVNKLTSVSGVEFKEYKENSYMINLSSPLLDGDRIEVVDGKLCHYHKMGMVVLDGSEEWHRESSLTQVRYRFYTKKLSNKEYKNETLPICDTLGSGFSSEYANYSKDCVALAKSFLGIAISTYKLPEPKGAEGFKQWLQENPTTVVYELLEPYYEDITPLQSDIVLETYLECNLDIYTKLPIKANVSYITNVPSLSTLSMRATEMKESDNIIANLTNMLDNEINE